MRIQIDTGDESVDLEGSSSYSWQHDETLFDLLKRALLALGYSEEEIIKHLTSGED